MLGTCERTVSCRMTAASPAATASPRRSCRGWHCRLGLGPSCAGSRPQPCRVPVAPGQYETPCPAGSARRAAPARSLARALRGNGGLGHADARAGRRAVAGASESDRHRCRVPRLADPGHGPARRDHQLPAATTWQAGPWSPASRAAMEQAMRFRRRAIRPRTPGSLAPSSCAATGNATPCASWKSGWGRPGSPSSCRRTARRCRLTLSRHFGVPWSGSPAPRGSQPCQPAGFSQAGAAIPSGRSDGDRRGGLTVKRPVDRRS